MAKPTVATTLCLFHNGLRSILVKHIKKDSLKKQFRKLAKIYVQPRGWKVFNQVWTEDRSGNVLFDTARGDHEPEVWEVRETPRDRLPLLIGKIKTDWGTKELQRRIREG